MTANRPFVAREKQLARLNAFLALSLRGEGQVCFVSGEAGSGKTALLDEFVLRAQERNPDLLVAFGQSDALTGAGDAYLPFREILQTLTGTGKGSNSRGEIDRKNTARVSKLLQISIELVVNHGSDLINLLVPGSGLIAKIGMGIANNVGWVEKLKKSVARPVDPKLGETPGVRQEHVFEQCANVLKAISKKQPLLLVLDDLQWADASSVELFFHVGRRLGDSRILLAGLYRPDEVALGRKGERHPLEKVLAELKRYYGDVLIDLDAADEQERRRFVRDFLNTEANRLDETFERALYAHTGGHALFTVELLHAMQERGNLVQDEDGRWKGVDLDWETFPPRVEGVIEERINRLEQDQRRILSVASVEGESFTTEVIAQIEQAALLDLSQQLSAELERKHHLVNAAGLQRLGARRLTFFRFYHNLFRKYLYAALNEVERAYLHEAVGNALEELYGDQANEIAERLALHFSEAGVQDKAAHYLFEAGKRAAAKYANAEALDYLNRALELTPETNLARRFEICLIQDWVYDLTAQSQLRFENLTRLEEMAQRDPDEHYKINVALRYAGYYARIQKHPESINHSEQAMRLAESAQDFESMARACTQLAQTFVRLGEFDKALPFARKGLEISRENHYRFGEALSQYALGQALVFSAQPGAQDALEQALVIGRELNDRKMESVALSTLATHASNQHQFSKAIEYYRAAISINQAMGDLAGECISLENLGCLYALIGDFAQADELLRAALKKSSELSLNPVYVLIDLSAMCSERGEFEAGYVYSKQALQDTSGNRFLEGYIHTCMGGNLLGLSKFEEAREAFQQALSLRRGRQPASLEMESLAGLARAELAGSDLANAKAHMEELLAYLKDGALNVAEGPFRLYLTCYQVLRASGDSRSGEILETAHALLQEEAAKIVEDEFRGSFLEKVPAHRVIIQEWQAAHA